MAAATVGSVPWSRLLLLSGRSRQSFPEGSFWRGQAWHGLRVSWQHPPALPFQAGDFPAGMKLVGGRGAGSDPLLPGDATAAKTSGQRMLSSLDQWPPRCWFALRLRCGAVRGVQHPSSPRNAQTPWVLGVRGTASPHRPRGSYAFLCRSIN